jgi:hypothetical protein
MRTGLESFARRTAMLLALTPSVPAVAQTQPTRPSAYATFPTFSTFSTAPLSPCYRNSSFNPTSSCYTGTPYAAYSATEPFEFAPPTSKRPSLPGALDLSVDQAQLRIETKGYGDVADLRKDDRGIWRGRGTMEDGRRVDITLDLEGNVYSVPSRFDIRIERAPYRPRR